jgi:hypothetical protein
LNQAGWFDPSKTNRKIRGGGKIHQFLWQCSRAASNANQELGGKTQLEAAPSRVK